MGEVSAKLSHYRSSPERARLVCDLVRGKKVDEALAILKFSPKKAARALYKLLGSAVANADNNNSLDVDRLFVKSIQCDKGVIWRRSRPRAHGRADRMNRYTCHIQLTIAEK